MVLSSSYGINASLKKKTNIVKQKQSKSLQTNWAITQFNYIFGLVGLSVAWNGH